MAEIELGEDGESLREKCAWAAAGEGGDELGEARRGGGRPCREAYVEP